MRNSRGSTASEGTPLTFQNVKDAEVELRLGFVRKVYGILSAQLILTVAIAAPVSQAETFVRDNQWLLWTSLAVTLITICAMSCCDSLARSFPTNYILLFTFTAFEGVLVGFVSSIYTWQSVVLALGITAGIFLGMTAFAFCTKTDFTGCGPYLYGALLFLVVFGFTLLILRACGVNVEWLMIAKDALGVLLFTFYIVFDTQLILGSYGGHKNEFGLDDYVFAALNLYLDIINLFLHLLALFGERR